MTQTTDSPVEDKDIRERILHVMSIFPKLSHSMLQIGLGTALPPREWRPVLNAMVEEGIIDIDHVVAETPSGRGQNYMVLSITSES